jgi:integrase
LDWKSLIVERQLRRNPQDGELFSTPKTKFGRRVIALGPKTMEVLRQHYERQQLDRKAAGENWEEHELIFPSSVGTPYNYRNLIRDFKKVLHNAGLPEIRFHDLRHTAASLMLNNGVPVIIVSRRLGHARPSITLDIYGHLIPSMQQQAAELMDELVTPITVELQA